MKKNLTRGLGRGLGSLLPDDLNTAQLLSGDERIQNIPISSIRPDPAQPRSNFEQTSLDELTSSIKQYGVIQPIVVCPAEQNSYSLVAGERRWRAAKAGGLKTIPAIVRTSDKQERLEIALIENVQRVDLSPIEQAVSIERLHQQFNLTYDQISKKLGKAPATIKNIVRLLHLPENARRALIEGNITEGHARAILALKGLPDEQNKLLDSIIKKNWSVREAEQFAIAGKENKNSVVSDKSRLAITTLGTQRLSKHLKTEVKLRRLAKGGFIEIAFSNDKHLDSLLKKIEK